MMPFKKYRYLYLALVLVAGVALYFSRAAPFSGERFTVEKWRGDGYGTDRCVRGPMTEDLLRNFLIAGQRQADVVGMLGQPDKSRDTELDYILGKCRAADLDILHLYFDRDEKLVKGEIRHR